MKLQSHRFQRFLLASVIVSAASFVASPAQAADVSNIPCGAGGNFTVRDGVVDESTSDCAGEITIPANVTRVSDWAFERRGLTKVSFAENSQLQTIGRSAFAWNNITSIELPSGLAWIQWNAFHGLKAKSIVIPGTVTEMNNEVFGYSSLEEVVFAARVTGWSIFPISSNQAFFNSDNLKSFTFVGSHQRFGTFFNPTSQFVNRWGYQWDGWSATMGGSIVTTYPNFDNSQANWVIYPNWSPLTFEAKFESNGGTPVAPSTIVGGEIQLPVPPTRVGYTFLGWTQWADGGGDVITRWFEAHTFGAKWNANTYTVNVNSKGGTEVPSVSFRTGGQIATAPDAPTRAGYTFKGWSATENGDVLTFPYSPAVMQDITLYAQWEKLAPVVTAGPTPNSKVISFPASVTEALMPATENLPSIKLDLSSSGGTAVATIAPTVNPATFSSTPFDASSTKIVDINITGITGSVTICIEGASTDSLFHFTGGKWEELPQRSYSNGQVCGVTSSFSPFAAATPRYVPSAPTNLLVTRGDKTLSISYTPGANNGAEISNYEYSLDNGVTWQAKSPSLVSGPIVLTGLTNGTVYSVKLRAVNIMGSGASSEAATGRPAIAPAAPTNLVVTRDDASLSIAFTAGANNGEELTRYQYSIDNGKTWARVPGGDIKSPVRISGLTNGTTYSVLLRAVNDVGAGASSPAVTGKPREPLLADSVGTDVLILNDPAPTIAAKSDLAVRGTKIYIALVTPQAAKKVKAPVTYYQFLLTPKTKGAAIVKQTYKAKPKGTTTAILTGKPKTSYSLTVTAITSSGTRKSWKAPLITTE